MACVDEVPRLRRVRPLDSKNDYFSATWATLALLA